MRYETAHRPPTASSLLFVFSTSSLPSRSSVKSFSLLFPAPRSFGRRRPCSRSRLLSFLRPLHPVLRPAHPALLDPSRVQRPTYYMVPHTRQILHTTAPHQHDRMLLQIVPLVRDISDHLVTVCQTHFRHLPHRGIRLLRRARHHLEANPTTKRRPLQRRRLRLRSQPVATLTHQLINCRH